MPYMAMARRTTVAGRGGAHQHTAAVTAEAQVAGTQGIQPIGPPIETMCCNRSQGEAWRGNAVATVIE